MFTIWGGGGGGFSIREQRLYISTHNTHIHNKTILINDHKEEATTTTIDNQPLWRSSNICLPKTTLAHATSNVDTAWKNSLLSQHAFACKWGTKYTAWIYIYIYIYIYISPIYRGHFEKNTPQNMGVSPFISWITVPPMVSSWSPADGFTGRGTAELPRKR